MRTDALDYPHEVIELREADRDQLLQRLEHVETRPARLSTNSPLAPLSSIRQNFARRLYAHVSSSENKDNLERQVERLISWCNAQGGVSKVVKECGSGINDQRPKFPALLADPKIGQIVVEHKDRASRFGVASIQTLLARPRTGTGHGHYC